MQKSKKSAWEIIRLFIIAVLVIIMAVSGYLLWRETAKYRDEKKIKNEMMSMKPEPEPEETPNAKILELQALNSDVVGWVTIDNTKIDYPFVWYEDNDFYLNRNINKVKAEAGTVFLDCRNTNDFSDYHNILYGHHMRNGSMFGDVKSFRKAEFFEKNKTGQIILLNKTYKLEIFACMLVEPDDEIVYAWNQDEFLKDYLTYLANNADQYRALEFRKNDRILTLSTCAYDFDDARLVLICKYTAG